jgi:hypothetical protein
MIGIHFAVKKRDAGNFHGIDNGINDALIAAFREIGNAFNQCGHNWQE